MGRQRFAGRVSEYMIAGCGFIRLDVPELLDEAGQVTHAGYTRLFGTSSIYSISPVSEDIARRMAIVSHPEPIQRWELPQLPAGRGSDGLEDQEDLPY